MTDQEKNDVTELFTMASKVPEEKREYLLGYMQCMVDLNDRRENNAKG